MPRAASLTTVVALALCSSASSFVLPWSGHPSPAYNGHCNEATTTALSHPSAPRPLSAPEDATDRIRSKRKRSSLHVRPAAVAGGVVGGGEVAAEASGDASDFCVLSSERRTGLEVLPVVSSSSAAPAKTEIPTDVAVVGAPQQVRLLYGSLAARCVRAAVTAGGGVPCYMTTIRIKNVSRLGVSPVQTVLRRMYSELLYKININYYYYCNDTVLVIKLVPSYRLQLQTRAQLTVSSANKHRKQFVFLC